MTRPVTRLVCLVVLAMVAAGGGQARATAPARLLVQATEFRLSLSRTTIAAGPAIVQLADNGEDAHDLELVRLDRRGRPVGGPRAVPEAQPGTVTEWQGRLARGRWKLFCSLQGHERRGMRAFLRVR
jgi:hypothetical protein